MEQHINDDIKSYNLRIAISLGLNAAVTLDELYRKHPSDGGWARQSYSDMIDRLPFLTPQTVRTAYKRLEAAGYIKIQYQKRGAVLRLVLPAARSQRQWGPGMKRTALTNPQSIAISPDMVKTYGPGSAIFLGRLRYWQAQNRTIMDGKSWVRDTYKNWGKQLGLHPDSIKTIVNKFEQSGVIQTTTKYNTLPTDQTKWYHLKTDKIREQTSLYLTDSQPHSEGGSKTPHSGGSKTSHWEESKTSYSKGGSKAPYSKGYEASSPAPAHPARHTPAQPARHTPAHPAPAHHAPERPHALILNYLYILTFLRNRKKVRPEPHNERRNFVAEKHQEKNPLVSKQVDTRQPASTAKPEDSAALTQGFLFDVKTSSPKEEVPPPMPPAPPHGSASQTDEPSTLKLYYEVIRHYGLPVTNHNHVRKWAKDIDQFADGRDYLRGLLQQDVTQMDVDYPPTLNSPFDIIQKKLKFQRCFAAGRPAIDPRSFGPLS